MNDASRESPCRCKMLTEKTCLSTDELVFLRDRI